MFNPRKIGYAALVALLALPVGASAVYAASTVQNHAVAPQAQPSAGANVKHDAETADDNESKAGPDTDNVQEGPGDTAEGPENEAPGQETPDRNEGAESKAK